MRSIRTFLVIMLLSVVTVGNFVAAVRGYLGSMEQSEQLFNERMRHQIDLLNYSLPLSSAHDRSSQLAASFPAPLSKSGLFKSPSGLEFQWVDRSGALLAKSELMPDQAVAELAEGFRFVNFSNHRWHLLVAPSADGASWFLLAERADQRYLLAESMILQAVYPMLFAIPVMGVLIWLVLGIGLKPIERMAQDLAQRKATDLHPLPDQHMPRELKQLARSANDLLRRLDASFARETRFTADAAHELRTPIAAMQIHCDNLASSAPHDAVSMRKLQSSVERMGQLVEQILILNRIAPDQLKGSFQALNLSLKVRQVIAEHSGELAQKRQQIAFNGEEVWIMGDGFAIESLLNNLLGNAIKYSPDAGSIEMNIWLRGDAAVLEVMDNGVGIPADQYERVFDRFYRVGGDRHESQVTGCGLGLSIVKNVAELHGAGVQCAPSRMGQGLLVMVSFPGGFSALDPRAGKAGVGP